MSSQKKIGLKILAASTLAALSLPTLLWGAKAQLATQATGDNNILIAQTIIRAIERKVDLSEVPSNVLSVATTASGARPTYAQLEVKPDGSSAYELGGQNQQGFDFELEIDSDGNIIEIDEQIDIGAVPEKVIKALKYWLPNAQIVSTWRSTRYQPVGSFYEIVIEDNAFVHIPADASSVEIYPQ